MRAPKAAALGVAKVKFTYSAWKDGKVQPAAAEIKLVRKERPNTEAGVPAVIP